MPIDYKNSDAERTTITRDIPEINNKTGNIYKSVVVTSKRANQIALDMREEVISKLNEFASTSDNLEETFENREQIEISRFYERLPKPNAIALKELLEDKIYIRDPEVKEDA